MRGWGTGGAPRPDEVLCSSAPRSRRRSVQWSKNSRGYYHDVEAEDLAERQPADLYGAALSHWNFARKRDAGSARIRVFNPTLEEHGWQSTHTIIEIVNDDMPFLVDSVTMEVNRHGLTMHLIIHPIVPVDRRTDGKLAGLVAENAERRTRSFSRRRSIVISEPFPPRNAAADIARAVTCARSRMEAMRAHARDVTRSRAPAPAPVTSSARARILRWRAE